VPSSHCRPNSFGGTRLLIIVAESSIRFADRDALNQRIPMDFCAMDAFAVGRFRRSLRGRGEVLHARMPCCGCNVCLYRSVFSAGSCSGRHPFPLSSALGAVAWSIPIKTERETEKMRLAVAVPQATCGNVCRLVRPGMTTGGSSASPPRILIAEFWCCRSAFWVTAAFPGNILHFFLE